MAPQPLTTWRQLQEPPSLPLDSFHLPLTCSEWLLLIAMAGDHTAIQSYPLQVVVWTFSITAISQYMVKLICRDSFVASWISHVQPQHRDP